MSRAFIKEDDGLVDFQENERARRERLELLQMFEKKKAFLSNPETSPDIAPSKKQELLTKIDEEIFRLRKKLGKDS